MSNVACRKAINFDLATDSLKKFYPGKNYRNAYQDVKKFMEKSGFEHRQWSGYISLNKLTVQDVAITIKNLVKTFPWLQDCVRRFDVTDIGEQHDLTHLITGKEKTKLQERLQKTTQKEVSAPKKRTLFSREQQKKTAQAIRQEERQRHPQKNKAHENER